MSAERKIDDDFCREVGASLLDWIAATIGGRWAGPRGALDYVEVQERTTDALVRDFVIWASGYSGTLGPAARENMEQLGSDLLRAGIAAQAALEEAAS